VTVQRATALVRPVAGSGSLPHGLLYTAATQGVTSCAKAASLSTVPLLPCLMPSRQRMPSVSLRASSFLAAMEHRGL
jgi:hypothetical protein